MSGFSVNPLVGRLPFSSDELFGLKVHYDDEPLGRRDAEYGWIADVILNQRELQRARWNKM